MEVVNPIRDGVQIGSGGSGLCIGWMNISSTPLGFWDCWGYYRAKRRSGGHPRWAQPTRARQEAQARPGGLCPPWVPPGPPLCSINTPKIPEPQGSRRNIHPAAAESRITISNLDTITEGFTTSIGASPMMREQFFVDLQVRSQQLDGFLSLAEFSIQWSLGDPYDVTLL